MPETSITFDSEAKKMLNGERKSYVSNWRNSWSRRSKEQAKRHTFNSDVSKVKQLIMFETP